MISFDISNADRVLPLSPDVQQFMRFTTDPLETMTASEAQFEIIQNLAINLYKEKVFFF